MLNRNEKLEIAKRLRHCTEMEMSRDDLELLLDAELAKPEAEMDDELLQEILDLLEDEPTALQQHASWQKIDQRASRKPWQSAVSGLARIAAAIVLLLAVLFATYGTARALNWEFLLRIMRPFAETFMVYTGSSPTPAPTNPDSEVYSDADLTFTQTTFATLADCPDMIDGYPAKPAWMPERFAYDQGSMYSDLQVTSITHVFSSSDGQCIMDISKFRNTEDATSYHFEQLPDEITTVNLVGYQVAIYHNTDQVTVTASWLAENTNYFITGAIGQEEIVSIIESMMK